MRRGTASRVLDVSLAIQLGLFVTVLVLAVSAESRNVSRTLGHCRLGI